MSINRLIAHLPLTFLLMVLSLMPVAGEDVPVPPSAVDTPKLPALKTTTSFERVAEIKMIGEYKGVTLHEATQKIMAELTIGHEISLAIEMEAEEDAIFQEKRIDMEKGMTVREVLARIIKASNCAYLYEEREGENILTFKLNRKK